MRVCVSDDDEYGAASPPQRHAYGEMRRCLLHFTAFEATAERLFSLIFIDFRSNLITSRHAPPIILIAFFLLSSLILFLSPLYIDMRSRRQRASQEMMIAVILRY